MGYTIKYGPEGVGKNRKTSYFPFIVLIFAAVLAVSVQLVGRQTLLQWLFPGAGEQTAEAFSYLIDRLRDGQGLGETITAFCKTVLENAR